MAFRIDPGTERDLDAVRSLLAAAGLTDDGLFAVPTRLFVARDGEAAVGAIAVERYGRDGLLRSLVLGDAHRGVGHGGALADAAEDAASADGIAVLYLLTETAEGFFSGRGYSVIDRGAAPAGVSASVEWAVACADTAVAMKKVLV